jgi:pimeloyl-ACP methyl ester carboxylesterase
VLAAALRHPDRVAAGAVVDGNYPRPGAGPKLAAMFDLVAGDLSTEGVMERLAIASRRRAERLCGRIDSLVNHTSLRDDVRGEPGLPDPDVAGLRTPVLAAYGGASDLLPLGRHLAALAPAVEYHELPGAGHRLVVERTADLVSLLVPWTVRHADTAVGAGATVGAGDGAGTGR